MPVRSRRVLQRVSCRRECRKSGSWRSHREARLLPLQFHGAGLAGPRARRSGGRRALLAMDFDDPSLRPAMELEGVQRWHPGDRDRLRVARDRDASAGAAAVSGRGAAPEHRVDAEQLELGGGLEVLLAAALERVSRRVWRSGRRRARSRSSCPAGAGRPGRAVGEHAHGRSPHAADPTRSLGPRAGRAASRAWRAAGAARRRRATHRRLARGRCRAAAVSRSERRIEPLDAVAEAAAPAYHWALSDRDALWADDVGELVEQASAQQWDASREIPWETARELRPDATGARGGAGHHLPRPERVRRALRPRGLHGAAQPRTRRGSALAPPPRARRARHIGVHQAQSLTGAHRGYALASAEFDRCTRYSTERDFTASRRCCSTSSGKAASWTC